MKLSVIIPAHDEEGSIRQTVETLYVTLSRYKIDHEILVVNDNSKDNTEATLRELQTTVPTLVYFSNTDANGFG